MIKCLFISSSSKEHFKMTKMQNFSSERPNDKIYFQIPETILRKYK